MALGIFQAFRSTVTPFTQAPIKSNDRWLLDPTTGAPIGVESRTANGAHARFTPVDITTAQQSNPTDAMLADIDATYRISEAPYTRYISTGTELVPVGVGGSEIVIPPGINVIYYAPLTISTPYELTVKGTVRVQDYPA